MSTNSSFVEGGIRRYKKEGGVVLFRGCSGPSQFAVTENHDSEKRRTFLALEFFSQMKIADSR